MLAHSISDLGFDFAIETDCFIISIGSIPESAIRPANTERMAGVDKFKFDTTFFICSIVIIEQVL